ncbi:MAG: PIN domain-containing protein [Deltaproteobacteria bacterium]|nr:PIN domain-containing protein [Deltaproteobacteria bacterium]
MAAKVFVDTNVLVYSRDTSETSKQTLAIAWMRHLWNTRAGRLSYQVLQEFYITVTEKLDPGLDRESARKDIRSLWPWQPIPLDNRVFDGAWHIQDRFGLSWWDTLIVSAAQVADCRYLLTEDLQDGQVFGNLQVVNPFNTSPEHLDN